MPVGLEEFDYVGGQLGNQVFLPVINDTILVYALYVPLELFLLLISVVGKLLGNGLEIHGVLDDLVVISDAEALLYHWLAEILTSLLRQALFEYPLGIFSPVLWRLCRFLNDLWVIEHVSQLWVIPN